MNKTSRTTVLLASFALAVLLGPGLVYADGPVTIELQGVDGGSAKGLLMLGPPAFLATLTGDMNVRVADCAGISLPDCVYVPGQTVITNHIELIDSVSRPNNQVFSKNGYGECYIGVYSAFESKFASEGLHLEGSPPKGWGGIFVRMVSDQPAYTDTPQSVACLLLFKTDASGVSSGVENPFEATGFILAGTVSGNTPVGGGTGSFKLINMIGDVVFDQLP